MAEDDPTLLRNWGDLLDDATAVPGAGETKGHPQTAFRERYEIVRQIGQGGMGTVYLVRDRVLQREAAMKVCDAGRINPELTAQFLEEARVAAQLEHPNILPVYDMGFDRHGRYFFIMRFVQGESLAEALARGSLGLGRRVELFLQICKAIRFAHSRGVLHRDLKPQNVLVGPFGEAFVIDWGISKLVSSRAGPAGFRPGSLQTLSSGLAGTPNYLPPEVLDGSSRTIDERTDLYALGVTLAQILGIEKPFDASSLPELVEQKRALRLPAAKAPREFLAIARMAMAVDPAKRYASVAQLEEDILAAQEHRAGIAWRDQAPLRALKWMRRHALLTAVAATALLAFAAYHVYRYAELAYQHQFQTAYVTTTPVDAELVILQGDREVVRGRTPFVHSLRKGAYRVRFTARGWTPEEARFEIRGGPEVLRLSYRLEPHTGELAILPADAHVHIEGDGVNLRRDAAQGPVPLEPGRYRVTLTRPGTLETRTVVAQVAYGQRTTVLADFSETTLWDWAQAERDGGRISAAPILIDLDGDSRDEVVAPVTLGTSTTFTVLDAATGTRRRFDPKIEGTVRRLKTGTDPKDRRVLLAMTESQIYLLDRDVRLLGEAWDAALVKGKLFFVRSGGVGWFDVETGASRVLEEWEKYSTPFQVLEVDGRVIVFRTVGIDLRVTAFDSDGKIVYAKSWDRAAASDAALLDGRWAIAVGDDVICVDAATGREAWTVAIGREQGRMVAVDGAFVFVDASRIMRIQEGKVVAGAAYRRQPPHGPIHLNVGVVGGHVAAKDLSEEVLRLFDARTCELVLTRPCRWAYEFSSGDFDGDGRGDLLVASLLGLEAMCPVGSGATAITTNGLPPEVAVEGTAWDGERWTLVHPEGEGVRLLALGSDGRIARERGFRDRCDAVTFGPETILLRSGGAIRAVDRAFVDRWRGEGPARATCSAWGRDFLFGERAEKGLRLHLISGSTGARIWTADVPLAPELMQQDVVDLEGDGVSDLVCSTFGESVVICGRHGSGCKEAMAAFPKDARNLRRQTRGGLVWEDDGHVCRGTERVKVFSLLLSFELAPDMDGDGYEELVAQTTKGIQVLDGRTFAAKYDTPGDRATLVGGRLIVESWGKRDEPGRLEAHDVATRARLWTRNTEPGKRPSWTAEGDLLAIFFFEGEPAVRLSVEILDLATGRIRAARPLGAITAVSRRNLTVRWDGDGCWIELYSKLYRLRWKP